MKPDAPRLPQVQASLARLNRVAVISVAIFLFGIGGWAWAVNLSGAVLATGQVVVEGSLRRVQHPSGGVVGQILVTEGQTVASGDVLLRLDDTLTRANLGIVRSQIDELAAREARLLAERDGQAAITFPTDLLARRTDATVERALAGEAKLIDARTRSREGQKAQLRERAAQFAEESQGISVQIATKEKEELLIAEELRGVAQLFRQNLTSMQRYTALQRDQTRVAGERGQLVAERARVRGKVAEVELQILQLDQDMRTQVLGDLRDTQGKLAELRERRVAAEDQLARVEIRAPISGLVHQLTVFTVGGVVAAGETLMSLVPHDEALVADVRVLPTDIDQLVPGQDAVVRVLAGNQRTTPDLRGRLVRIGADLTREPQTGLSYFTARIALPESEIRQLQDLKLVPGMPIQAFIKTQDRSALDYLLRPLVEQAGRAFRER
ncbi:HlyD family secretion protein [Bosea sp. OAE506]|uniref:HlyD family type I secretion periplasmic adaptor subunit n=1 Tax=Bosea sp. OAE506 TaxID=2663870 RepID=UPI001789EF67